MGDAIRFIVAGGGSWPVVLDLKVLNHLNSPSDFFRGVITWPRKQQQRKQLPRKRQRRQPRRQPSKREPFDELDFVLWLRPGDLVPQA